MQWIMHFISSTSLYFLSIFKTVSIFDVIDILLVAVLFYEAILLVRETRAVQLLKGIILFVIVYYFAQTLNLKAMTFILVNLFQYGVIALLIVFQPELRSALEHIGSTKMSSFHFLNADNAREVELNTREAILAVCEAAQTLQKNRIGALILFERQTKLGEIIKTGTILNADISADLLVNVFYPKSPLHDGAMVVRDGRIYAAGCFLPLSQNQELSRELGTRHRSALGISEGTDVLVVVVSEETGIISLVERGIIKRNLTIDTLRIALEKGLLPQHGDSQTQKKSGFKVFGK